MFYTLQTSHNGNWKRVIAAPLFKSELQAFAWMDQNRQNGIADLAHHGWRVRPATEAETRLVAVCELVIPKRAGKATT